MLKDNLNSMRAKMADVARACGRNPSDIVLVGVTKYSDAAAINEAVSAGLEDIAENRVQAAQEKFPLISGKGVRKHLIGHLQSNKAKEAVHLFDLIHSVDSIRLLTEIDKRAAVIGKIQDVLLQVDIAQEEQKFGLPEQEAVDFVAAAQGLKNIRLMGLMTMAPLTEDKVLIRQVFRRCRELFESLRLMPGGHPMRHVSMGMSGDFNIAIEEGATMVRIGSAIFK